MSDKEMMMFSHKNSTLRRKHSSCNWKQWCCIIVTIYCCLNHSAYGQLPSALTTTKTTSAAETTTTTKATAASRIISTTKTITPRVIVESIAVDEYKKPIKAAGNDEADEKTATEILQLPHAFRHQQHYSHRIEQAVNDFKQQQQQQINLQQHQPNEHIEQQKQQESHLKERDKLKSNNNNNNNNNKKNINDKNTTRYHHQQSVAQWQDQQHHQRRHEHHTMQQQQQQQHQHHPQQQQQQPLYHLRHRNHYAATWEKQNIPTLRHQRHRNILNKTTATTTTTRAILQQLTTEAGSELEDNADNGHDNLGPQLVSSMLLTTNASNNNAMRRYFDRQALFRGQPVTKSPIKRWSSTHTPHKWRPIASNQLINKNLPDSMYSDAGNSLSGKRLTLKIQENQQHISTNFANNLHNDENNNENIDVNDDDIDDADDDYSYEQTEEDFFMSHELATDEQYADKWNNFPTSKPPVKRFTNPFKNLFKSLRGNEATKYRTNKNDEDIADEKYRLRVQQHHIRQQQHQQELEAMRSWHAGIDANMVNNALNKHNSNSNSNSNRNHNHQASVFMSPH